MTNIFWFHTDPRIAARMHADMHVPKMAVEAAQSVATALRRNGYVGTDIYDRYDSRADERTPQDWCTESKAHAAAAIDYGIAVIAERNRRWPDRNPHSTLAELRRQHDRLDHPEVDWPHTEWHSPPPTFGIPSELERVDSVQHPAYVHTYREYARVEKDYADAEWTATPRPSWCE